MKTLRLSLKRNWFELTKSGEKKEDYREITPYWFVRLVYNHRRIFKYLSGRDWDVLDEQIKQDYLQLITSDRVKSDMIGYKPFDVNVMTLGYPKSDDLSRVVNLEHKGIEVGWGKPKWGGDPNKLYFIIKHGNII